MTKPGEVTNDRIWKALGAAEAAMAQLEVDPACATEIDDALVKRSLAIMDLAAGIEAAIVARESMPKEMLESFERLWMRGDMVRRQWTSARNETASELDRAKSLDKAMCRTESLPADRTLNCLG
jgi:hypothetical protein